MRLAFLRKVYGIVSLQLLLTAAIVYALRTVPGLLPMLFRRLGPSLGLLPMIPLLALSASPSARDSSKPLAYILLALFTALEGLAIGAFTWMLPAQLILRAGGATAIATGGLSLYALNTKRDFTVWGGMLSSILLGLLALSLMQAVFGGSWLMTLRSGAGVAVFCAYLVMNTQMMMGGNKRARK